MKIKLERWFKLYSDGNHNAFTDICWFKGQPYCTFRQGTNHVSEDGRVLVLRGTKTGERWQVVASIRGGADTRDPKLMATDEGLFCYSFISRDTLSENRTNASGYSFTADGDDWAPWHPVEEREIYWRPRWHAGRAYMATYATTDEGWRTLLKSSADGREWEDITVLAGPCPDTRPNETSFDFLSDGTCFALVRRESPTIRPLIGKAAPPYTDWEFEELDIRLQGPCLWVVEDEVFISGRWYQPGGYVNTAIFRVENGTPACQIVLPSGGDTSYMGAARHPSDPRRFWLTYYSSHEHNPRVNSHEHPASIYFCDVLFVD